MIPFSSYFQSMSTRSIAAISLLVTIAVIVFVAMPAIGELQKQKETLTQMRDDLEQKRASGQSFPEILRLYERYRPYRTELSAAVMPTGRRVEFITTIEQTAETSGVLLEVNADTFKPLEGTTLSTLPFNLNVTGNFEETVQFLARLERLPQYLTVDHIAMRSNANQSEDAANTITTTIQLTSYWQD